MRSFCLFFFMSLTHIVWGQEVSDFTSNVYSGNINGVSATLKIEPGRLHNDQTENRYYGMILGNDGSTYILMGDMIDVNQMVGSAWDKFTAQEFKFLIKLNNTGLSFNYGLDTNYGATIEFYKEGISSKTEEIPQGNLDPLMIGVWRRTDSYSDAMAGFSYVIEEILLLNQDGTTIFYSKSAGGNGGVTGSTPGQELRGFWKTENNFLFTSDYSQGPWMNNGNYLVDQNNMMLKQSGGNKLWSRIQ